MLPTVLTPEVEAKIQKAINLGKSVDSGYVFLIATNDKIEVIYREDQVPTVPGSVIIWMANAESPESLRYGAADIEMVESGLRYYRGLQERGVAN